MPRLLRRLGLLTVFLLAIGSSTDVSGRSALATPRVELTTCQEDLEEARQAVATADQMLALARKKKLVLIRSLNGDFNPVDPDEVAELLILKHVTGKITLQVLADQLSSLARAAKSTQATLIELGKEARKERDELAGRCGSGGKNAKGESGAKAGVGDLRRTGLPIIGPDQTGGLPWKWSVDETGATIETAAGNATFTWAVPVTITKAGAKGKLTVTADPGTAKENSNLAVSITIGGEVTFLCGADAKPCAYAQAGAYTKGGNSPTGTMTFTVKPNNYGVGRKDPVLLRIDLGPNGRSVTFKYEILS